MGFINNLSWVSANLSETRSSIIKTSKLIHLYVKHFRDFTHIEGRLVSFEPDQEAGSAEP